MDGGLAIGKCDWTFPLAFDTMVETGSRGERMEPSLFTSTIDREVFNSAVKQYILRLHGDEKPLGAINSLGVWVPEEQEVQYCCRVYQREAKRWKRDSWERHCYTLKHVASLNGITEEELGFYLWWITGCDVWKRKGTRRLWRTQGR